MRRLATSDRIRALLSALGRAAHRPGQAYLAGGATAVLLGWPDDFIPVLDGWEGRGRFETQEGKLTVYHFDLVAQALAKIHRGAVGPE